MINVGFLPHAQISVPLFLFRTISDYLYDVGWPGTRGAVVGTRAFCVDCTCSPRVPLVPSWYSGLTGGSKGVCVCVLYTMMPIPNTYCTDAGSKQKHQQTYSSSLFFSPCNFPGLSSRTPCRVI